MCCMNNSWKAITVFKELKIIGADVTFNSLTSSDITDDSNGI